MMAEPTRAIGPIGTIGRAALGLALGALAFAWDGVRWWEAALGLVGIPALLVAGQLLRRRSRPTPLRATDHVGVCLNAAVVAVLLITPYTADAALLWLAASALVAAWRGYAGCESLAIPNWLLRRDDQVGCLLFAPLDGLEARRAEKGTTGAAG